MSDPTQPSQPTSPIHKIVQGKNPREYFDPAEMAELEEGIRAVGVPVDCRVRRSLLEIAPAPRTASSTATTRPAVSLSARSLP